MFLTDKPINTIDDDLLCRKEFVITLAENLINYEDKECLTFGLYGSWGSGKTSIINMLISYLSNKSSKPIVVKFNPWLISDQNQLFSYFFKQLASKIEIGNRSKNAKDVGEKLVKYSKLFEPLSLVPGASYWAGIAQKVINNVGEAAINAGSIDSDSIIDLKAEIEKHCVKFKKKIIVVIDDIDRLNNAEIRQVFQLVKSIGDFKNVIYLLSFDKNIVCKALHSIQEGNGEEYLEKIIQVPFEIPLIDTEYIYRVLFFQLNQIISSDQEINDQFDNQQFGNIFHDGFKDLFRNIRDVNRFVNSLKFNFNSVKHEVNVIDFMTITAIQVFVPSLHAFIRDNKDLFCGVTKDSADVDYSEVESEANAIKQLLDVFLNNLETRYKIENIKNLLKRLFPKIETIYGSPSYTYGFIAKWRIQKKICVLDNFDIYFKFFLSSNEISTSELNFFIENSSNLVLIDNQISKIFENGKIIKFLDKLSDYISQKQLYNIENILKVLYNRGDFLPVSNQLLDDNKYKIIRISRKLLKQIPDKTARSCIYKNILNYVTLSLYTVIFDLSINAQEQGEDNPNNLKPEEDWLLTSSDLEDLKVLALDKIEEWAYSGKLNNHPKIEFILYRWKQWGSQDTLNKFVTTTLTSKANLPYFLYGFCKTITGYGLNMFGGLSDRVPTRTRKMELNEIADFIPIEKIVQIASEIKGSERYSTLNEYEKEGIDLFLQAINNKGNDDEF